MKFMLKSLLLIPILAVMATCQTSHSAVVGWAASSTTGVTYELLRGSVPAGPFTAIQSGLTVLAFTDPNLQAHTQYCYEIIVQGANNSDSSPNTPICGSTDKDQAAPAGAMTLTIH